MAQIRFDVLTLFPEMCRAPLDHSILKRARDAGLVEANVLDLRDWAPGRHRQADDTPYGGGSGMVLKVDVIDRALQAIRTPASRVILLEASGTRFDQRHAVRLSACSHLVFVCGHYEGVDDRVRTYLVDEALSVGDYVLTGGELPALVILDAVARLVPGVLGNAESVVEESFSGELLEYPHFTRPREYRGWEVPEVLLSGNHARIRAWRAEQARLRTERVRAGEESAPREVEASSLSLPEPDGGEAPVS